VRGAAAERRIRRQRRGDRDRGQVMKAAIAAGKDQVMRIPRYWTRGVEMISPGRCWAALPAGRAHRQRRHGRRLALRRRRPGRTVAVKILLPSLLEEPGFTERFRARRAPWPPSTTPVSSTSTTTAATRRGAYLVMEYVEGDALSRTLHGSAGSPRPAPWRWWPRPPTRCTPRTRRRRPPRRQAGQPAGPSERDLVLTDFGIARRPARPS
jgi:hypothetical protein